MLGIRGLFNHLPLWSHAQGVTACGGTEAHLLLGGPVGQGGAGEQFHSVT